MQFSIYNFQFSKKSSGFTLIELLVVISIIGILATLVAANLNSARSRARDAARKSDLKNIQTALRLYYNDKNAYPSSLAWGTKWSSGTTTYMESLPADPLPGQSYYYSLGTDSDNYTLAACLENTSDASGKDITTTSVPSSACPSPGWVFILSQ